MKCPHFPFVHHKLCALLMRPQVRHHSLIHFIHCKLTAPAKWKKYKCSLGSNHIRFLRNINSGDTRHRSQKVNNMVLPAAYSTGNTTLDSEGVVFSAAHFKFPSHFCGLFVKTHTVSAVMIWLSYSHFTPKSSLGLMSIVTVVLTHWLQIQYTKECAIKQSNWNCFSVLQQLSESMHGRTSRQGQIDEHTHFVNL